MSDLMLFFLSYSISLFILSSFVIGIFRVIDRRITQIEREMTMIVSVLLGRIQNENLVETAPKPGAYSGKASELTKKGPLAKEAQSSGFGGSGTCSP